MGELRSRNARALTFFALCAAFQSVAIASAILNNQVARPSSPAPPPVTAGGAYPPDALPLRRVSVSKYRRR
ncbi:hypothetical protein C8R47DRAFT_1210047 [Mycena vitilis]|nr:hypothetical protein C8R47DRAFT_1210047 [Mycena vitilis]